MKQSGIDPTLTINEIIRRYPAAITVLNAFGVDSCCGGGEPLATVARRDARDLDAIVVALNLALSEDAA
jgi:regulator of cell morphogenesis and NO signaling